MVAKQEWGQDYWRTKGGGLEGINDSGLPGNKPPSIQLKEGHVYEFILHDYGTWEASFSELRSRIEETCGNASTDWKLLYILWNKDKPFIAFQAVFFTFSTPKTFQQVYDKAELHLFGADLPHSGAGFHFLLPYGEEPPEENGGADIIPKNGDKTVKAGFWETLTGLIEDNPLISLLVIFAAAYGVKKRWK